MDFKLPVLYITTKIGKEKLWKTWTSGSILFRQDYFVGGKQKLPTQKECTVKNAGRKNEVSAEDQACLEACSFWINMLQKDYLPDPKDSKGQEYVKAVQEWKTRSGHNNHGLSQKLFDLTQNKTPKNDTASVSDASKVSVAKNEFKKVTPKAGGENGTVENVTKKIKPMLAYELDKGSDNTLSFQTNSRSSEHHKVSFEDDKWYVQKKLDGVRCVSRQEGNKVVLTTRGCKQFVWLWHIRNALSKIFEEFPNLILDGELYAESLTINNKTVPETDKFGKISGACRSVRKNPAPYETQISYYIFDIIDIGEDVSDQEDRFNGLLLIEEAWKKASRKNERGVLRFVKMEPVANFEDVEKKQAEYIEQGNEGTMLRKRSAIYEQRRSHSLLKYKNFTDSEYLIVGAKEGSGTEKGCIVYRCETEEGLQFDVRPNGSFEERKKLYRKKEELYGELLNVRYQGKSLDGIPRFPVGRGIRYDLASKK